MQRRFVRFLLLIVALATVASACSPAAVEARLTPTSGGGSYRPPPPPLDEFQRLGTIAKTGFRAGEEQAELSRSGRYVYWVDEDPNGPDQLWLEDLSTGQSQLVHESTGGSNGGGIRISMVGPHGGDEALVKFSATGVCGTGCTWSPTAGLYVAPAAAPGGCKAVLWSDEHTMILECNDPLYPLIQTERLRYDLLTGEVTSDELEDGGQLDDLYLHSASPDGRYQLFVNDILAAPLAKVKDTATGSITQVVGVSGAAFSVMLFPLWWQVSSVGAINFVNWYGVTDEGEVVYDKEVYHRTLRVSQIRLYDIETHTDSILPGYDAVNLSKWSDGAWMVDYDVWNEIGRNAYADGREPDQYFELSNKNDPSERYGLPDDVWVKGVAPDGRLLVTSVTPLNLGDPAGSGVYYHDVPA